MTAETDSSGRRGAELIPSLVTVLGGVLFVLYVGEQFFLYDNPSLASRTFLVGFFVAMVFIAPLLGGGYWLARSDLAPKRYPRIGKWILGGLSFFLLINLTIMAVSTFGDSAFRFSWGRWTASVGAAGGLLVGYVEARAIQRELQAQRAAIRAEEAENQRQWLDYLNGLLRHEVLNTANVIVGYASLHLEDDDVDDATASSLETIHRQGKDMTRVIRDVQVLIEVTQDTAKLQPTDLGDVLADELEQVAETHENVGVEASIPDRAVVLADDLLPRVFGNLFRNAVEHNDSERPEIRVTVEREAGGENDDGAEGDETVSVRVEDNGPGVPSDERATLFDRSDNSGASHGLGLYLVGTLAERYGGSAELTETGPEGSVFTVTLRAASPSEMTSENRREEAGENREEDGETRKVPARN
jgi:signal transduction histidine kinase